MGSADKDIEKSAAVAAATEPEMQDEKRDSRPDSVSSTGKTPPGGGMMDVQPGPQETVLPLTKLDSKVVKQKNEDEDVDVYAHLPQHEADILRRQVETKDIKVGYFTLFKFADFSDWVVFAISVLCAVASGASMPLMTVSDGSRDTKRKC
jgi:ATP-binding cassette, subfamily B (MDR/TAP), member 1